MLGIAIIFFISVYLVITIIAIRIAVVVARRSNRRGWVWGLFTGLVMYNLVLWDLIPSYILFNYYCNKDAGVHIYVDAEQWVKEHPEAMKPFKYEDLPWEYKTRVNESKVKGGKQISGNVDFKLPNGERWHVNYNEDLIQKTKNVEGISVSKPDGSSTYYLTKSVVSVSMPIQRYWFGIVRREQQIRDLEVNKVIVLSVKFSKSLWIARSMGVSLLFKKECEVSLEQYGETINKFKGIMGINGVRLD